MEMPRSTPMVHWRHRVPFCWKLRLTLLIRGTRTTVLWGRLCPMKRISSNTMNSSKISSKSFNNITNISSINSSSPGTKWIACKWEEVEHRHLRDHHMDSLSRPFSASPVHRWTVPMECSAGVDEAGDGMDPDQVLLDRLTNGCPDRDLMDPDQGRDHFFLGVADLVVPCEAAGVCVVKHGWCNYVFYRSTKRENLVLDFTYLTLI